MGLLEVVCIDEFGHGEFYVQELEHDKYVYFVHKYEHCNLYSLGTQLKQDRRYFTSFPQYSRYEYRGNIFK
jgi:hypothetical protein